MEDSQRDHRALLLASLLACIDLRTMAGASDLTTLIDRAPRRLIGPLKRIPTSNLERLAAIDASAGARKIVSALLRNLADELNGGAASDSSPAGILVNSFVPKQLIPRRQIANKPSPHMYTGALGDGHLHSGGLSSPFEILEHILPYAADIVPSEDPLYVRDPTGRQLAIDPLVLGLCYTSLILEQPQAEAANSVKFVWSVEAVTDFWSAAWQTCLTYSYPRQLALNACLLSLMDVAAARPNIGSVVDAVFAYAADPDHPASPALGSAAHAIAIIHGGASLSFPGTLDDFISSFSVLGQLRKRHSAHEQARLTKAIKRLVVDDGVSRFELRKNLGFIEGRGLASVSEAEQDLSQDIQMHATACRSLRQLRPDQPFIGSMPVTFCRGLPPSLADIEPGQRALSYAIAEYIGSAEALVSVWLRSPSAAAFTGAIDVVGGETRTPNWVFSLIFSRIIELCDEHRLSVPVLGVHAGEQFTNPLNGMRRIGELRDFRAHIDRIGHALALGEWPEWEYDDDTSSALDALQDLVWLGELQDWPDSDIRNCALSLADYVFSGPVVLGWDDLCSWRTGLFDLERARRVGLLGPRRPIFEARYSPGLVALKDLRFQSVADKLLAATLLNGTVDGWYMRKDLTLPEAVRRHYLSIASTMAPAVREYLLTAMRETVLEACPTSNIALGGVKSYCTHPLWDWSARSLLVTVSSDDPGIFGTTIGAEYDRLARCAIVMPERAAQLERLGQYSFAMTCHWMSAVSFDDVVGSLADAGI